MIPIMCSVLHRSLACHKRESLCGRPFYDGHRLHACKRGACPPSSRIPNTARTPPMLTRIARVCLCGIKAARCASVRLCAASPFPSKSHVNVPASSTVEMSSDAREERGGAAPPFVITRQCARAVDCRDVVRRVRGA